MTYRGRVKGGVIVFEQPADLPEGTEVTVQPISVEPTQAGPSLAESLLKLAGRAQGLPKDAARNHDHYLYGTPKR
ncbi:MAG: hypothetical protein M3478_07070 [Planctomycetota bacterium]|nr:hypothetical protein [Planctomycetota bacterium]